MTTMTSPFSHSTATAIDTATTITASHHNTNASRPPASASYSMPFSSSLLLFLVFVLLSTTTTTTAFSPSWPGQTRGAIRPSHASASSILPISASSTVVVGLVDGAQRLRPRHSTRGRVMTCLLQPPPRYASSDWIRNLISLPQSKVIRNIRSHLFFNTAWAAIVAFVRDRTSAVFQVSPLPHTLVTSALGLLLVFRTNSAYERFWEARRVWGAVWSVSRNLARIGYCTLDRRFHVRFTRLLVAFPVALKVGRELDLLLGPHEAQEVRHEPNPPQAICQKLSRLIVNAIYSAHQQVSMQQALSQNGTPRLRFTDSMLDFQFFQLQALVGDLVNGLGQLERILMTPIPVSYSRHTSRLLSLYCLTMPFVLVGQLGYFVVPATIGICWGLFSIEEIGHMIEQPFNHPTLLPMNRFTKGIISDVEGLMKIRMNHEMTTIMMAEDIANNHSPVNEEEERLAAAKVLDELREMDSHNIQLAMARYMEF